MGTQDGAAIYDGRAFREVRACRGASFRTGSTRSCRPPSGEVYFATDAAGISCRRAGPFRRRQPPGAFGRRRARACRATWSKALGRIRRRCWSPAPKKACARLVPAAASCRSPPTGLPAALEVTRLAAAPDGDLWIGTHHRPRPRSPATPYRAEPLFAGRRVEALFADERGVLAAVPGAVYRRDAGGAGMAAARRRSRSFPRLARLRHVPARRARADLPRRRTRSRPPRRRRAGLLGLCRRPAHRLDPRPGRRARRRRRPAFPRPRLGRPGAHHPERLERARRAAARRLPRDDINAIGEAFCCGRRVPRQTERRRATASRASPISSAPKPASPASAAGRWDLFTSANCDLPSDNVNGVLQAAARTARAARSISPPKAASWWFPSRKRGGRRAARPGLPARQLAAAARRRS